MLQAKFGSIDGAEASSQFFVAEAEMADAVVDEVGEWSVAYVMKPA